MKQAWRHILFFVLGLLALSTESVASHLRAADIVAVRLSELRYLITLTVYTDFESVDDGTGTIPMGSVSVTVNDELIQVDRNGPAVDIGNLTFRNTYFLVYDFPAVNNGYNISFEGVFRNDGIINIAPPSGQQELYVESFIFIDGLSPVNSTPQLLVPPIDLAAVGEIYTHNPGAWDPDGDSIAFEKLVPAVSSTEDVNGYLDPDDPSFGAGSNYSIDPLTGDIRWDTPLLEGEYNIAFKIKEFRNGVQIGYVVRDMQIIVKDTDNKPPIIYMPSDTCVSAERLFVDTIYAADPDGDRVSIQFYGGLDQLGATATVTSILPDSVMIVLQWYPTCDNVQAQDLRAIIRAVDDNIEVPLSSVQSWAFSVSAPEPENLTATTVGEEIHLEWDEYPCTDGAQNIHIWRVSCDSTDIVRTVCAPGVPSEWGLELIASISPSDTTFIDDGIGEELQKGVKYFYLISVDFALPSEGESYASNLAWSALEIDIPLITRVSVTESDEVTGQVSIDWVRPPFVDSLIHPGPYEYRLFRSDDLSGSAFGATPLVTIAVDTLRDSSFVDQNLNTLQSGFSYRLDIYDGLNVFVSSSEVVSTVLLTGSGSAGRADLEWETNVNWFFADTLYQIIWEIEDDTVLTKLDSVSGGISTYSVSGLETGDTVCYLLETRGVFCIEELADQMVNYSNEMCLVIEDTVPPCKPSLDLDYPLTVSKCENFDTSSILANVLNWAYPITAECDTDILGYVVYFRPDKDGAFNVLDTVFGMQNQSYVHDSIETFAGCYALTVVDHFGNESVLSDVVCNDNCEYYELPNIFTPNGDESNDLFVPMPVPRFVKKVEIWIYNRWGALVHYSDDNINVQWDGLSQHDGPCSDGLYYYEAQVEFFKLTDENAIQDFKGWIVLMR